MIIRKAEHRDGAKLAEIYNYFVVNTHHSFEQTAISIDEMLDRVDSILESCPFLVCEIDGVVRGFAYGVHYKPRSAYKHSVEVSVYVEHGFAGNGCGKALYTVLLNELRKMQVHAVIAGISLPNEASAKLHESFGFEKVAHFREVGRKMGKWIDVGYWELLNDN